MENALTLTLKGFPMFAHWCGSQKQKMFGSDSSGGLAKKLILHSSLDSYDNGFSCEI